MAAGQGWPPSHDDTALDDAATLELRFEDAVSCSCC